MTRTQLEHAIRAACDVANDTELLIFGSQAMILTLRVQELPLAADQKGNLLEWIHLTAEDCGSPL